MIIFLLLKQVNLSLKCCLNIIISFLYPKPERESDETFLLIIDTYLSKCCLSIRTARNH